jgi:hypothetical protein
LSKRVTALLSNTNISSVKSAVLVDESLNLENLVKIEAKFTDLNFYDSVSGTVKPIDVRTLREIEKIYFVSKSFSETEGFIVFRYPTKPIIYISKKDGLLYAFNNGREERKQAWHLLRILAKFGYVENFKRIQHRKPKETSVEGWTNHA